jgi:hypothetical protein
VTCRHVIELLGNRSNINAHYESFAKEKTIIGKMNYNKRIKDLALEWLSEKEEYAGLFNQPWKNSEAIVDRLLNDEAVFHYLKRRPIFL